MDHHSVRMPKLAHPKKFKARVYHDSIQAYHGASKAPHQPQRRTPRHNYSSSYSPNNQLIPINMPPSMREGLNRTEVINLTNKPKKLPTTIPAKPPVNRQIMVEFRPDRLANSPDAKVEVLVSALHPRAVLADQDSKDFFMFN